MKKNIYLKTFAYEFFAKPAGIFTLLSCLFLCCDANARGGYFETNNDTTP